MTATAGVPTLLLLSDDGTAANLSAALAKLAPEFNVCHLTGEQEIQGHPLPRVIVLDLDMARESAFALLSWTRSQPQYKQIPVIALTGLGAGYADRAYALGANFCLQKPAEAAQMDSIRRVIGAYASLLTSVS